MPAPTPPLVRNPNIEISIPLTRDDDGNYLKKKPLITLVDQMNEAIREAVRMAKGTPVMPESIRVMCPDFKRPYVRIRLKSDSSRVATKLGRRDGFKKIGPISGRGAEAEKPDDAEDWPPDAPEDAPPAALPETPEEPFDPTLPPEQPEILITDRAAFIAEANDIDPAGITGTGKDGQITVKDVRLAIEAAKE